MQKKKAPAALGQALTNEVTQIGTIRVNSCFVDSCQFVFRVNRVSKVRVDSCRVSLGEQKNGSCRVGSARRNVVSGRVVSH